MPDIQWTAPGATLSHKNTTKEFGLTEEEIIRAIKEGSIHYQITHAHGNPYYPVVREEVVLRPAVFNMSYIHKSSDTHG